jgi:class 3 adenylate cyclase
MLTGIVLYFLEPYIAEGMVPLPHRIVLLTLVNNFVLIASLIFLTVNYYTNILKAEKLKTDELIHSILPAPVVSELNTHGKSNPIMIPRATAIFMDFVGFTRITQEMGPHELVSILNEHFTNFDQIFVKHKVEKLKTIGDGYMAVGGLPEPNNSHPLDVALAAMSVISYMKEKNKENSIKWKLRIGIHTGPMVAGIIGETKFSYDVWGSSVNLCSRLETASMPDCINVSEEFMEFTKDFFDFEPRGCIEIKNREPVNMYFLTDIKKELRSAHFQPNELFYERYKQYIPPPILEI